MDNVNNITLLDEPVTYDPNAALNPSTKIPDGWYLMEFAAKSEPIMKAIGQQPCVEVNVQGKIIDPGGKLDGFRTSGFVNSYVFDRGASVLHALLKGCGTVPPASQTLGQLQQLTTQTLSGNPQARARIRWEASVKDTDGTYQRKRGMRNFPQNPDGSYDSTAVFTLQDGTTATAEAREQFVDFKPAAAGQAASN